jgi:hypothetical protein
MRPTIEDLIGDMMERRLIESGLADFVIPGELSSLCSWELDSQVDHAELRRRLLDTGWIEDPLPALRARTKPFVKWSLRESKPGPGLHLEDQTDGLRVHLDVLSPGHAWWLMPAHLFIDYRGWSTTRVRLIRWLARTEAFRKKWR